MADVARAGGSRDGAKLLGPIQQREQNSTWRTGVAVLGALVALTSAGLLVGKILGRLEQMPTAATVALAVAALLGTALAYKSRAAELAHRHMQRQATLAKGDAGSAVPTNSQEHPDAERPAADLETPQQNAARAAHIKHRAATRQALQQQANPLIEAERTPGRQLTDPELGCILDYTLLEMRWQGHPLRELGEPLAATWRRMQSASGAFGGILNFREASNLMRRQRPDMVASPAA